jgi:hypothetical protein
MFTTLRKRLHLTPATAIAALALVFAMTGGAYAAGKYVITSTKQISPKVLKSLQGKAGPAGKPGATGAAGAQGNAGAPGAAGEKGASGEKASAGEKGLTGEKGEKGAKGEQGEPGEPGEKGEPWTPNNVLPKNATETGAWFAPANETTSDFAPISFPIPLSASLESSHIEYVTRTVKTTTNCPGTAENPAALTGFLCIYESTVSEGVSIGSVIFKAGVAAAGASPSGAVLIVEAENTNSRFAGTFAVKAAG